ncbi:hypothetical protein [Amycolatopsis sp. NPDC003676]
MRQRAGIARSGGETPSAKSVRTSAGALGLTIVAASILGYLVLLIAGKYLSPAENAVFLGFWGLVMGVGSALSPLEQELSRQTAVAEVAGARPDATVFRACAVSQSVAFVAAGLTLVPSVNAQFFGPRSSLGLVAFFGIAAFPALYATRGVLIGAGRSRAYSVILLAEAGLRMAAFLACVAAGIAGLTWLAVSVAAGSFAWLFFIPAARGTVDRSVPGEAWDAVLRRMLGLTVSAALTASVLTGYPAVVKLLAPSGSDDQLGGLFLAVSLVRSPLLLVLAPVQTLAVPMVVRITNRPDGAGRLRRIVAWGGVGALVAGVVAAVGAYVAGLWLFGLLYQDKYRISGWTMAALGWSGIMMAATLLAAATLVARKKTGSVVLVWAVVAAASFLVLVSAPGGIFFRAVAGATAAPTIGLLTAVACSLGNGDRK